MLEFPGRPSMVTLGNRDQHPVPAIQEYLPAVQTAPFDLVTRSDVPNAAFWRETLVVDEALERLAALDALIIFEVSTKHSSQSPF